eukprot:scaffold65553_cov92-Phaeocystis_antarctica.AAC.1
MPSRALPTPGTCSGPPFRGRALRRGRSGEASWGLLDEDCRCYTLAVKAVAGGCRSIDCNATAEEGGYHAVFHAAPSAHAPRTPARNPRRYIPCRTRFKTAIAAARPFLGLCPPPLLWLKALDALYNFPAAGKVVGGKPGGRGGSMK